MLLLSHSPALFAAWIAWCLGHSLTASRRMQRRLRPWLRLSPPGYRLAYVLFSILTLLPICLWHWRLLPRAAPAPLPWQLFQLVLCAYSAVMFYLGGRTYDLKAFFGFAAAASDGAGPAPFRRSGILAHVRHPWYSGGIALLLALGTNPTELWDWRLLLTAYLVCGCRIEEWRLGEEFGPVYRQYRHQVPMLIPRLGRNDKPGR